MVRLLEDELRALGSRPGGREAASAARVFLGAAGDVLRTAPRAWVESFGRSSAPAAGEAPARGVSLVDDLAADLRYGVRGLRRQPGFTLSAVAILGLGVGASAALFSVADRALLRPLPYAEPDRLVAIWDTRPADGRDREPSAPGNFLDWAQSARFEAMTAWQDGSGSSTLRGGDGPAVVETVKVTPSFFRVLGTPPRLGRTFHEQERGGIFDVTDRFVGGDRTLVMSHGLWSSRFGSDPRIVGGTILLDGLPWRVVGIMPASFALPRPTTQLFLPWDLPASFARFDGGPPRDLRFLNVLARLRAGVSRARAEAELQALSASLAAEHPKANAGWSVRLVSLGEELTGRSRPALLMLSSAVALVLLLGCANLTSLQLARAAVRRREMAVRLSLGASRRRLVRQLLTEGLLLAILGGAAGVIVARLCVSLMIAVAPDGIPGLGEAALDGRVLAFTAALALLTSLLFGLTPAREASRAATLGALHEGSNAATAAPRVRRTWRLLVVGEAAAALVLLIAAGLLGRSFLRVLSVDAGFEPRGLLTLRVSLDHASYAVGEPSRAFYRELMKRLAALPGVAHAGAVTALPLSPVGTDFARPWWHEGEQDPGVLAAKADIRMATPGYFDALGLTLRRGRAFADTDGERAPRVIIVNEVLARRAFGDADPLGRRLILDYLGGAYPYEIVGVVNDVRFSDLKATPRSELFIPHAQNPYLDLTVAVRSVGGDAAELARRVEREIRAIDPGQPVHAVTTMEDLVRRSSSDDRFASTLLAVFAGLALVLTATGIHGLLAFLVAQRARELSLRQALGATPPQVGGIVLSESLRLVAAGCGLGGALAVLLAPVVAGRLFETSPADPLIWGCAFVGVVGADVAASLLPALTAARLDPRCALRAE
jgi:putative ABC transport system permease protein